MGSSRCRRIRFPPIERDFGLSADERDLVGLVRKWADDRVAPAAARYEEEERFPRDLFRELGEMGFGGVPYDERYGGGGHAKVGAISFETGELERARSAAAEIAQELKS